MCTGADREDRDRGGKNPVPGAPSRAASRPLRFGRPPGERAGGRVALEAGLCQEESLPGHRGSPNGAMRRMSARSLAGGISRARAAGAAAAAAAAAAVAAQPKVSSEGRPRPATPPPRPRRPRSGRHGNGITGAECCLFSAECQEIRPGGCQAHLPGVGGGRGRREDGPARPGLLGGEREGGREAVLRPWGSLTPPRGGCSENPDCLPAMSGSSFPRGAEIPPAPRPAAPSPPDHCPWSPPAPACQSLIHSLIHSFTQQVPINTSCVSGD